MRELATELGVNRATLFRWVGSRDDLLAEIIWSLGEPTLALAAVGAQGHGGQRIAMIMGHFAAIRDGKHTSFNLIFDRLLMLDQLGLIPAPAPAG